ncbi:RRQRL motif-containing zinc-binding protein [Streptomyces sp. NPDC002668]|uniref:RRQRL motif-containing zinc-binding protein n=1 Tax=Streptomyces sp. NPDC002668 TaxID=3154422 RepID=UPI00331C7CC9
MTWRNGKRKAWLYRVDLAKPKRKPTLAQEWALDRSMAARQTCPECHRRHYCLPLRTRGCCNECNDGTPAGARPHHGAAAASAKSRPPRTPFTRLRDQENSSMPRLPINAERLALIGTLLTTFGELHPACDLWVIAAKTVSTMPSVSILRRATGAGGASPQGAGVAVVRRHCLASRFALVGGRRRLPCSARCGPCSLSGTTSRTR